MPVLGQKLLIVSNRLPVTIVREKGDWRVHPQTGGLFTALAPIVQENHGVWIGWPGCNHAVPVVPVLKDYSARVGWEPRPVHLAAEQIDGYDRGFARRALFPLFHDRLDCCVFDSSDWETYCDINRRFAEETARAAEPNSFIWVHDYHLLLVGRYLRKQLQRRQLSFFLHSPFPPAELFRHLPWRQEIMAAMFAYDRIGFQTKRDRRNFIDCVTSLLPESITKIYEQTSTASYDNQSVELGHCPIGVDFRGLSELAGSSQVAAQIQRWRRQYGEGLLTVAVSRPGRLSGTSERLLAFERLLDKHPDIHGKLTLLQILTPDREENPGNDDSMSELRQISERVNTRFAKGDWTPTHLIVRHLDRPELAALFRTADIALVTPLRAGMALVAKEYCACNVEDNGVLILSEFAGAAGQLGEAAIAVNPHDIEGTADAVYGAFGMDSEERQRRMSILREEVRRFDTGRWIEWFLGGNLNAEPLPRPAVESLVHQ
jgi:trehalose 6-phosphate synthase/phosphatase